MITTIVNLLTFGILFSSIISITSNNPIISIIFLISAFVIAAGYLILLGINFIGISYIVIYVGAIAVLFLFIILMINIKLTDILDTGYNFTKNLPIGLNIASLLLFIFFSVAAQINLFPFYPCVAPKDSGFLVPAGDTTSAFPNAPFKTAVLGRNQIPVKFSEGGVPTEASGLSTQLVDAPAFAEQEQVTLLHQMKVAPQRTNVEEQGIASQEIPSFTNSNINTLPASAEGEISDINLLEFSQIEVLGQFLYTYASIFLIILSLILLLAMLAIIIISKKNITNI
jgi:NADH-ubiquinone oxidoreductase chain 6